MSWRALLTLILALTGAASLAGCPANPAGEKLHGQVKLTLLHTADIHSRLFPYGLQVNQSDSTLGLGAANSVVTVGGIARVASVIARERARSDRVLHLDGGDCFQGAPIFNFYNGEAEVRAMSTMGIDAQVIANHEFDKGALNVRTQVQKWADYPELAANYLLDDVSSAGDPELSNVLQPFTTFNLRGLKVGVIGMGNLSTISSLFEHPNRLGITPLETIDTAQAYIDLLRPLVDVVVVITHLGLGGDQEMIRGTEGIDVVLGGHNHIVLQPPQVLQDCGHSEANGQHFILLRDADGNSVKRYCNPRRVVLAHSGAFSKYVGRLDLVFSNDPADMEAPDEYRTANGFELISHQYQLFPITADLPMDRAMVEVLEPYRNGLDALVDLDLLVGYAPDGAARFGTGGGDSPLGNLVASAVWRRLGIETDFSFTNSTGIRADLVPGPITTEQMFNIFPFDNSITKMDLSGVEVQAVFDFVARKSATRGCASQVQIAGTRVVLNCNGCKRPPKACKLNDDCESGECAGGACVVKACADHIYIGATDIACSSDADCKNQQNACDLGRLDKAGKGRCLTEIDPTGSYELATSNYLAQGGSGFTVLKKNTTQLDTHVQQRDALIDWVRGGHPCGWDPNTGTSEGLPACSVDSDCGPNFACACPGNASEDAQGVCVSQGSCNGGGRCVLSQCRQGVADFYRSLCADQETAKVVASCAADRPPCRLGGEQCKYLGCVDRNLGSVADGRVMMVGK
jgi:5'-nucleotidase / UDP-sugar diphosphatase